MNDEQRLFAVIRGAFSQRRKTLLNALSSSLMLDKSIVNDILESAGVDPTLRAERLTLEDFGRIADELGDRRL